MGTLEGLGSEGEMLFARLGHTFVPQIIYATKSADGAPRQPSIREISNGLPRRVLNCDQSSWEGKCAARFSTCGEMEAKLAAPKEWAKDVPYFGRLLSLAGDVLSR